MGETLSREATAAAFQKHLAARGNYVGSWDALADLFTEDATYWDVFYGEMQGREAIRSFLREAMNPSWIGVFRYSGPSWTTGGSSCIGSAKRPKKDPTLPIMGFRVCPASPTARMEESSVKWISTTAWLSSKWSSKRRAEYWEAPSAPSA